MRWRVYASFESFYGDEWFYNLKFVMFLVLSSDKSKIKVLCFLMLHICLLLMITLTNI